MTDHMITTMLAAQRQLIKPQIFSGPYLVESDALCRDQQGGGISTAMRTGNNQRGDQRLPRLPFPLDFLAEDGLAWEGNKPRITVRRAAKMFRVTPVVTTAIV